MFVGAVLVDDLLDHLVTYNPHFQRKIIINLIQFYGRKAQVFHISKFKRK